jgi:lysophospholipase L1-like esterase
MGCGGIMPMPAVFPTFSALDKFRSWASEFTSSRARMVSSLASNQRIMPPCSCDVPILKCRAAIVSLALLTWVSCAVAQAQVVKILPLGDSLTRGNNDIDYPNGDIPGGYRRLLGIRLTDAECSHDFLGSRSDNAAPGMDPDHDGFPGWRTDQVQAVLSSLLSTQPDTVLLMLGTNDIMQAVPIATAAMNLGNIIEQINGTLPACRIYVATIPPVSGTVNWNGQTPAQMNANANSYNTLVRGLVQQHAALGRKVTLVDMNALITLEDPDPLKNFFQPGDGIHPGQAGYDQLAELWFAAIHTGDPMVDLPAAGLPAAPSGLSLTVASPSRINLTWTDNATNETVHRIRRRPVSGGAWEEIAVLPANTTSHAVTGLKNGIDSYAFTVIASNTAGNSAWSNVVFSPDANDKAHLKPAVASSVYNNLDQYAAPKGNDGSLSTIWSSGTGSSHFWQVDLGSLHHLQQVKLITRQDNDVAAHRQNFQIRASNDLNFATHTVLATQGSTPLPFKGSLTVPVSSTTPFRYVRVIKTDLSSFSICLVQVSAADLVAIPAAPSSLTAMAAGNSRARLSWTVSSNNESGFKLERKTGAGPYSQIAAPAAASNSFTDSGLAAGTTYLYRIRATNESGDSAYAAETSVTTGTGSTYDAWAAALPPEDRAPSDDPNGDGVNNLLAYAFALDPLDRASSADLPRMTGEPSSLIFRFRRNIHATDTGYEVLVSTDLTENGWTVADTAGITVMPVAGETGVEEVSVPVLPAPGQRRGFYRLRVVR